MNLSQIRLFNKNSQQGFTLLELLIAIAIVAIIAVVAFVSLNPQLRFQDARDSTRFTDVAAVLDGIKIDQVDNGGNYLDTELTTDISDDTNYMIGTATTGCNATPCDVTIGATDCVDITALADEGYIAYVPVSPNGDTTANWSGGVTGYYVNRSSNGSMTVGSCESENEPSISVAR